MGQLIMNLAELHTEGRFGALFDSIDALKKFLSEQNIKEESAYG